MIEIGAIVPPLLPPRIEFNITNAMLQLLNLKGVFTGLPTTTTMNLHLMNFLEIHTSNNLSNMSQDAIILCLFFFLLTREATTRGQVVDFNREINFILMKIINANRIDWVIKLDDALWAYHIAF